MKIFVPALVVLLLSSVAYGTVYIWTDSAGVTYFTNKDYEIPIRYRAKAKPLYPEQADAGAAQQNAQLSPVKPAEPQPSMPQPQQTKPEEPVKNVQPPIASNFQKPPSQPARRRKVRNREASEE